MTYSIAKLGTFIITAFLFLTIIGSDSSGQDKESSNREYTALTKPKLTGQMSLEECIAKRRSIRDYSDKPLNLNHISQLLWAAQGITSAKGLRTAPSAGALYPLEIYLVASNVQNLQSGIYRYECKSHRLIKIKQGKFLEALSAAAWGQSCVRNAPANIVIAAEYERTRKKYGDRAERYVHMEVGSVCQNIYLQAESLGMGTVAVGAFIDDKVKDILGEKYLPLLIMPIGLKP